MKKSILLLPLVTLMTLAGCSDKTSSDTATTGSTDGTSSSVHVTEYTVAISGDASMAIGRTQTLSALVSVDGEADASLTVNWMVDDESIATIDYDTGLVTALAIGNVKVTACMNDAPYKMGTFDLTIVAPTFDASLFPVKDNYTAAYDCGLVTNGESGLLVSDSLIYMYENSGYTGSEGEAIFCFDDDLVYLTDIRSATEIYYYEGENLKDSDGVAYTKEAVLDSYDGTEALSSTDYTFVMHSTKYDCDYFATLPKEGETVDAWTEFAISLSALTLKQVTNAYASISETPISMLIPLAETDEETGKITYTLVGSICGLKSDGSLDTSNIVLSYQFYDFGTSDLGVTPVKKAFHTGGEAGEWDGNGEDFDHGSDDGDTGDSEDTGDTGDGE